MRLRYLAALTVLAAFILTGSAISACDEETNKSQQQIDAAHAAAIVSTDEVTVDVSIHHTTVSETPGILATAKATARAGATVARAIATTAGSVLAAIVRTAAHTVQTLT